MTNRDPVPIRHFPDRLHAVIWRNWDLVPAERLGLVLRADANSIIQLALAMGLPPQRQIHASELQRSYITIIRRNWHLLPEEQLCALLGWKQPQFQHALMEEDFLWVKLGLPKPACAPLIWSDESARIDTGIKQQIERELATLSCPQRELPFSFIHQPIGEPILGHAHSHSAGLRLVYPYYLRYGEALTEMGVNDVPDSFLANLRAHGMTAIWVPGVLNQLAPWKLALDLSSGWQNKINCLNTLIERAARHGLGVYLYLNEPRGLPPEFFDYHPALQGVPDPPERMGRGRNYALCTSSPEVRSFLVDSVRHLFMHAENLAGILTITHSENLTHCYSRQYPAEAECPRCKQRGGAATIADVNHLIAKGMREASSAGHLIVWDWAWPEQWAHDIIKQLPTDASLMRVSEWGTPFRRGDHEGKVGEYSISVVGPSEESIQHWQWARQRGMKTVAKVQIGNSWELSPVPYIPAMALIARHMMNLKRAECDGLMLGWTLGGLPSLNTRVANACLDSAPDTSVDDILRTVAMEEFSLPQSAATQIVDAWQSFSQALEQFPFDINVIYLSPLQMGPANLLYAQPTGYGATMTGLPYDDLDSWRGPYSPETLQRQFALVTAEWQVGIDRLKQVSLHNPTPPLAEHVRIAEAAGIHFKSVANQVEFIRVRDGDKRRARAILQDEITLARRLYELVSQDSRIGFEATNHYFYVREDLLEKVLNCRQLLKEMT